MSRPRQRTPSTRTPRTGGAQPKLQRRLNATLVLDALRASGPMRVSDLVDQTGLSRPTIDAVADELIGLGWVAEAVSHPEGQRGRPARRLVFRPDAGYVLGLDIGEHTIRCAVADLRGDIITEQRQELQGLDGPARLVVTRQIARTTLKTARLQLADLLGACVGCTGGIDPKTGEVLFTSAFPGLEQVKLRSIMQRSLGCPVVAENDCNLAVVAERWRGIATDTDDVVCVLASERMGAGIVIDGRLVRGHAGVAGEMPFLGAYEQESGAEGIAQLTRELATKALANGADGTLKELAAGEPHRISAETVFAAARAGDPVAIDVIDRSLQHAGPAIAALALVLNPELIVIGGGIANAGELITEPLRRQLAHMARLPPRLEASTLGDHGVVIGAVRHALDDVEPRLLDRIENAA